MNTDNLSEIAQFPKSELCVCCEKWLSPLTRMYVNDIWEGRMDDYCDDCAQMRCDISMHGKV